MISRMEAAAKRGEFYITIAPSPRVWRNFNICKGHIYGYSPELRERYRDGHFVLRTIHSGSIELYIPCVNPHWIAWGNSPEDGEKEPCRFFWNIKRIGKTSINKTFEEISKVLKKRIGGVEVYKGEVGDVYCPCITTPAYTPTKQHVRISGEGELIRVNGKPIVFNANTSKEAVAHMNTMLRHGYDIREVASLDGMSREEYYRIMMSGSEIANRNSAMEPNKYSGKYRELYKKRKEENKL